MRPKARIEELTRADEAAQDRGAAVDPTRPIGFTTGVETRSDAALVAACLAGDQAAWNDLVERFSRYVFAISTQAFRLDADDAEDVFQEVFARIFDRLGTLRDPEALRPWIAQLTRRECIDRIRASTREAPVDELPEHAEESLDQIEEAFDVHARARLRCRANARRSSTGSSVATRATARSATSSGFRPGPSPAASPAASGASASAWREETRSLPRPVSRRDR